MLPWYFALAFCLTLYFVCLAGILVFLNIERRQHTTGTAYHIQLCCKTHWITNNWIEKNEDDKYFKRLEEWNPTPSTWKEMDRDELPTHPPNTVALPIYSKNPNINITPETYTPLTEEEIKKFQKNHDYTHLWYAEFIKDGELTLSLEEFHEEFRKRFLYPKYSKDEWYQV